MIIVLPSVPSGAAQNHEPFHCHFPAILAASRRLVILRVLMDGKVLELLLSIVKTTSSESILHAGKREQVLVVTLSTNLTKYFLPFCILKQPRILTHPFFKKLPTCWYFFKFFLCSQGISDNANFKLVSFSLSSSLPPSRSAVTDTDWSTME